MNELLKINYESGQPTISGRELHSALEVKTAYKDWFPRMCEYGFTEGTDFSSFLSESTGGRPSIDHQLTIDMAKQLCMIQRTETGKKFRKYFITVEESWNSPDKVMARALVMADRQIKNLQIEVTRMKPKEIFADSVCTADTTILIGELAKILKHNGIDTGEKRLFKYLREKGYLIKRHGTDYNMPTQKSMDLGLFGIKETTVTHADGTVIINKTAKVTGKGQQYFVNKFLTEYKKGCLAHG